MKLRNVTLLAAAALSCLLAVSSYAQSGRNGRGNRGTANRGGVSNRGRITTGTGNTGSSSTSNTTGTTTTTTTTTSSTSISLRDYLKSNAYSSKENITALTESGPALADLPEVIVNNEGAFIIHKEKVSINNNSTEFFGTEESIIFPGNLIYVNRQLVDGNPVPCRFSPGRVSLTINLNLGFGKSSTAIVENTYGKVHDQILKWLNEKGESMTGSLDASGKVNYYNNTYQMALDLKVSVDYLQSHAHVNMNTTSKSIQIVSVEDFSQDFYSVSAEPVDNDPLSLFGSSVDVVDVQNGVSKNGPIGMVAKVTYGRRAYRFREYTQNDFTLKSDEQVKYSGVASVDASSTSSVTSSNKCSSFWAFVQGGNHGDGQIFNDTQASDSPGSNFMKTLTANTMLSAANPGVAKNYTITFLMNNAQVVKKSTGEYWSTTYQACPKNITFEIHKEGNQVGGSAFAYKVNYKVIHVKRNARGQITGWEIWDSPRTDGAKNANSGYVDYTEHKFSMGEGRWTKTLPTNDCPDKENCYIYDVMYFRLQGNRSAGRSWELWEDGYIPVSVVPIEVSGPVAKIYIGGSNYSGNTPYIKDTSTGKAK